MHILFVQKSRKQSYGRNHLHKCIEERQKEVPIRFICTDHKRTYNTDGSRYRYIDNKSTLKEVYVKRV